MGDRHDYVALEWVKGEIAETLKQARQALEAFVENPQDPTRMRFCLTYVHQVQGTLQMVEFYGAALLAEEMEQLVQALLDGRVPNQGEALEVLMQAILQLPIYLDRIQTARRDLPMVVLPLLNDLRAARGEKLLSETSLFAPDLSQRQPQLDGEAIAQLRTDELGGLLRKLRQTQQMALVGLLRNQDVATSLGYLARVYARLEGLCREAPLGPLWSIASGLVEGLANGSVVNSASVRTLLRQLDRELKRLVEQGADGLNQAAPDELVKNLLFYVAKAPSQSPRIRALKEQYRLDEALPDHETVDAERARLAGPDRDAMRSVVGALCEELVRIKDSLDLFVRSDRGHPSELDALLAPLKQIADTLAVLGFGQPRKVILDQLDVIHALAQGRREPSDAILMDVAGALLYVEATLAGMAGPGDERNSEESRLPTTDVAQIHQLVIKEARNGLEQAKDAIIEFIASQWNHEHLARVPELLTQVRGGLAMIPLERAATLLETCNRYIQEQLLARKAVPDWQSLDTLADAITSVEYYLERLSEDHASQSDLILDVAEDSLANLGYTLKPNSSAPAEPGLSGPAAVESPAAEPERPEAVVELAETAEQPPADRAPAEAAREDAPQLASDDNWTLGEVAPDAGEPSLDLALDLPLDDSAEVPPALPEVVEESGQPQSTPAPARSLDDFSLDEIDLSGLDLPADAAPASGPAALADWSLPEQWGLGDDLAQPAQAGETLDLSLEEPALSFDAPQAAAEAQSDVELLDPQLLEIFTNEAETHLEALVGFLADCARELPQPVTDALQRALHTLKGSAHMAGILPIAEIATPLEKLVKEYKSNLLAFDLREAELLHDAEQLFRIGLEQVGAQRPLNPIPGSDALLERIEALHQERIASLEAERYSDAGERRDPLLIEAFLVEGMDILLDAEDLLERWHEHPQERQELSALREELSTLDRGARHAELPQVEELCQALLALYDAVEEGRLAVSPAFFEEARQAHEALIGMMDQVAAGLQVTPRPERVAALQELLEAPAAEAVPFIDPESLGADDFPPEDEEPALPEAVFEEAGTPAEETVPAAPAPAPGRELDEEMVSIFLEEAVDILESAGQALAQWQAEPGALSSLSALQRDLHTLKGGARMAEIAEIGDLAHELEALYEGLVDRRYQHSPQLAGLLQACHDRLAEQLDQLSAGQPLADPHDLIQSIRRFRQGPVAEAATPGEAESPVEELVAPAVEEPAAPAAEAFEERDPELVEIFLEEGFDILDSAAAALQRWMDDVDNTIELEALQRDLHTLKGGARMAEIGEIGDLAHELEFLYEGLCGGRLRASPALFGLLQRCHDELAEMLEAVRGHRTLPDGQALIAEIRRLRSDPDEQLSVPTSVSLKPLAAKGAAADESEILDIFLEEADDLLENLELALGRWDGGNGDAQPLDDLLRILHTLKGGARLAGQTELGNLAHDLEQHLTDAQQQGAPWPDSLLLDAQSGLEGLQRQVDLLRERLAEDDEAGERPEPAQALVQADDTDRAVASALAELTRLAPAAGAIMAAEAAPPAAPATTLPFVRKAQEAAQEAASRRAPQELVKVPAELLENLVNLAGETSIFRGRVEQQVSDVGFTLGEMESTIERVRDQLRRLDTETQAQILSRHQADAERAGYEEFDPLEMDRYSQLQQLSRALFESASDLLDLKETLAAKNRDAETLLLQQARVNTELQEGLMRTRMVPFDRLVPRLRRIVRQVAGELGKQVEFVVGNADGEMDRTVLERIVAPLEHMLRNAVDHGIESGETRRAAGKPEHGTIRLNIGREGGDILLTLSDDGAGIRLDAVRRKAIERGLMSADSDLSDHEVLQFVLESGFSTAEKVTQISGRGVGLDVANSEVKQLGGSVSIQTEPGQGTRFNVRLPFTVSVNRALMVLSGEDLYAVPLNTIEGIVRVSPYELEALYDQRGEAGLDTPSFEYAGQSYELKYLGELLNNGQEPKLVGQSLPLPVILVRSSEHAVAVQVDSLAGSREIVVKSLGPQFAGVAGISGATLLGDGRVVVILDLLATIRSRHALLGQESRRERLALRQEMAASESEQQRPPLVMVVDDSVTVRKVTTRLLERNGMNVLTAKDGVDAIAQLQEHRPDILLLDIEMPRMDGFEVATLVRHDERLGNLPIIMITSRTGEKHRERALGIGVNQYLGKPYQETELLEAIQSLVGQHE
ncbi:Hpt domain-containing protein [Pseudomonas aeruginosa]|uniref:Hpt domain-containing protein n=2 Tax=Pseudomonas aeruginosa TaxID=287 RepID=UPI002738D943|nr:Hpt domain-containing protein [Pseudomonas aeruginosa]